MNTQNFSTFHVFQLLSRKNKTHFLYSCPKKFIRFLCEYIVNLLKRKLKAMKRHHVVKLQDEIWILLPKKNSLEANKKRSFVKERIANNSSHYTSCH